MARHRMCSSYFVIASSFFFKSVCVIYAFDLGSKDQITLDFFEIVGICDGAPSDVF